MFSGTTTSEYSIFECPPLSRPLIMGRPTSTTTKWKCANIELAPNCPRCASTNTKFCYYNNYSLSQPRYFCKGCRRYWTKGGSLRNVPIGGGCRKSRRARASRQNGDINHACPTLSPGGGPVPGSERESGECIDLAAVFAKYVNPNLGNEESFSPGVSSGSSLEIDSRLIEDVATFEYDKEAPMDLMNGGAVPQFSVQQEIDGQEFAFQDLNGFELQQGMIGGDQVPGTDVLWSEEGTSLPNLVQPLMQVQDFGFFSPDDQFRISANMLADNWASFDLPAYEFFFNP